MAKNEAIELGEDVGFLAKAKTSNLQQIVHVAPLKIAIVVDRFVLELLSR